MTEDNGKRKAPAGFAASDELIRRIKDDCCMCSGCFGYDGACDNCVFKGTDEEFKAWMREWLDSTERDK